MYLFKEENIFACRISVYNIIRLHVMNKYTHMLVHDVDKLIILILKEHWIMIVEIILCERKVYTPDDIHTIPYIIRTSDNIHQCVLVRNCFYLCLKCWICTDAAPSFFHNEHCLPHSFSRSPAQRYLSKYPKFRCLYTRMYKWHQINTSWGRNSLIKLHFYKFYEEQKISLYMFNWIIFKSGYMCLI